MMRRKISLFILNLKKIQKLNNSYKNKNNNKKQNEEKEVEPPTESFWIIRQLIRQIILKHPLVAAFSIAINNSMARNGTTRFSFFNRKRAQKPSSCEYEVIIVV